MTLLRDYLQQHSQHLQGAISPGSSTTPGFDPTSPLKLAVSVASAGTQTSPCRPLSSASSGATAAAAAALSMASLMSPGRNLSTAIAQVSESEHEWVSGYWGLSLRFYCCVQAVNLSLSSGGGKPAPTGVAPASRGPFSSSSSSIPLSPPIPTVSVTPSPSKTPRQPGSAYSLTSTPSTLTKPSSPPRPKKTGSLALFYRKVYMTAHLRIKDLCERLDQSQDFHQK